MVELRKLFTRYCNALVYELSFLGGWDVLFHFCTLFRQVCSPSLSHFGVCRAANLVEWLHDTHCATTSEVGQWPDEGTAWSVSQLSGISRGQTSLAFTSYPDEGEATQIAVTFERIYNLLTEINNMICLNQQHPWAKMMVVDLAPYLGATGKNTLEESVL